jgi:hypothetical protein
MTRKQARLLLFTCFDTHILHAFHMLCEGVSYRVAGCEGSCAAESSLRAACPCGFNPASRCSAAGFLLPHKMFYRITMLCRQE